MSDQELQEFRRFLENGPRNAGMGVFMEFHRTIVKRSLALISELENLHNLIDHLHQGAAVSLEQDTVIDVNRGSYEDVITAALGDKYPFIASDQYPHGGKND